MGTVESLLFPDLVHGQAKSEPLTATAFTPEKKNNEKRRRLIHPASEMKKKSEDVVVNEVPLGVCHYKTGAYVPVTNQNLTSDGSVHDCIVGSYTNVLIFHKGKVLLGERISYPQMRWWFPVIGRISPGLMPQENCQMLCQENLGLKVDDLSRFEFVGTYSYLWGISDESVKKQVKHEISIVFAINLESNELPKDFSAEDYNDMKWISIKDVVLGDYHPALRRAFQDYNFLKDLTNLVTEVASKEKIDDSKIGRKFKSWCLNAVERKFIQSKFKDTDESMKFDFSPKVEAKVIDSDENNLEKTTDKQDEVKNLDGLKVQELNEARLKTTNEKLDESQNLETLDVAGSNENLGLNDDNKKQTQDVEQKKEDRNETEA